MVKYGPYGHYHAHYDSSRKSDYPEGTKCCHYDMENAPMAKCRICRYAEGQPSKFDEQYALDILASLWSLLSHSSRYQNGSLGNICNVMGASRICRQLYVGLNWVVSF